MTRYLSEALGLSEPGFSLTLRKLERAFNHPSEDIKFTLELKDKLNQKLSSLGLDASDSESEEIYEALKQKLISDNAKLTRNLRTLAAAEISAEADLVSGMVLAIKKVNLDNSSFSLKTSKLKSILKASQPKKTMKALGYRSIDSMLKREPAVLIYCASSCFESPLWQSKTADKFKRLSSSDFEESKIVIYEAKTKRWVNPAKLMCAKLSGNIFESPLTGSLVILPLENETLQPGVAIASLYLALEAWNNILLSSTYLRAKLLSRGFSKAIVNVISGNLSINLDFYDSAIPWQALHLSGVLPSSLDYTNPFIKIEQFRLKTVEESLAKIEPELNFWQGTAHLAAADKIKPVSFNLMDNALNVCNNRSFNSRIAELFRKHLWVNLISRYLSSAPNLLPDNKAPSLNAALHSYDT